MPALSYKKRKDLLTPTEKDRLVCLVLTHFDQIQVNHNTMASELDCTKGASSMSLSRLMKKLKESGGLIGEDGDITKTADSTSPPKKAGKKGEKKRVATSDKEGTSEGPPKAKKARGKKTSGDSGKTESGDDEQD